MQQDSFVQAHEYDRDQDKVIDPHKVTVRLKRGGGWSDQGQESVEQPGGCEPQSCFGKEAVQGSKQGKKDGDQDCACNPSKYQPLHLSRVQDV